MFDRLVEDFCQFDDFCQAFGPHWEARLLSQEAQPAKKRGPQAGLADSEIMTILIAFHQSHYRDFKAYYGEQVLKSWRSEFPGLVSYTRFVEYIPSVLVPLAKEKLQVLPQVMPAGALVDSTLKEIEKTAAATPLIAQVTIAKGIRLRVHVGMSHSVVSRAAPNISTRQWPKRSARPPKMGEITTASTPPPPSTYPIAEAGLPPL